MSGLEPLTQEDSDTDIANTQTKSDEGTVQTFVPDRRIPGTRQLEKTGDALEELNRVLWEVAKAVWIIIGMLIGLSLVVLAGLLVLFVWGFAL